MEAHIKIRVPGNIINVDHNVVEFEVPICSGPIFDAGFVKDLKKLLTPRVADMVLGDAADDLLEKQALHQIKVVRYDDAVETDVEVYKYTERAGWVETANPPNQLFFVFVFCPRFRAYWVGVCVDHLYWNGSSEAS